jgi:hypothetical protein
MIASAKHTNAHGSELVRPSPESDGSDAPRLGFKFAPTVAAMGDDVFVVFEDAVGEPVVAHKLPEVF